MTSRLRDRLEALGDAFWLRPALLVLAGALLGEVMVWAERAGVAERWTGAGWVYAGGASGARALLGAVASSTIGVAGTVFSITVAALSLASGQMGPRLLRNFTRDSGNQMALGIFLGTFAYALTLLRTVRSVEEVPFVPHLGITGAVVLASLCVGTLVWFVHHIASSINVDTVIGSVHGDLSAAIAMLEPIGPDGDAAEVPSSASEGKPVRFESGGYLRSLDVAALADWAAAGGVVLRLRVRPGDYLFPGGVVAEVLDGGASPTARPSGGVPVDTALAAALSTGERQAAAQDLEFAVRQLVEVAVRALSPGVNDPFTAMAVLDRLGAALCEVADRRLPASVLRRGGRVVLVRRVTDYDGLCDAMFHMIRENARGSAAVLIRLIETVRRVAEVEKDSRRRAVLRRHAELALAAGRREVADAAGRADLEARGATLSGGRFGDLAGIIG